MAISDSSRKTKAGKRLCGFVARCGDAALFELVALSLPVGRALMVSEARGPDGVHVCVFISPLEGFPLTVSMARNRMTATGS